MFAYLKGILRGCEGINAILDVRDVGYAVFVPPSYEGAIQIGGTYPFYIATVVREDQISLYAFHTKKEKSLFLLLTDVQGVGGRLALVILAYGTDELLQVLKAKDAAALETISGVGKKLADRLVRELFEKVMKTFPYGNIRDVQHHKEVYNALSNLGYKPHEVKVLINECLQQRKDATLEELILDVLQKVGHK
ncbi:MAG: Holliday junction ATP-dependent DNA helicase RuvA [Alphaproteobacteria bacterium]|nr:Holliday junction ATP-dependent DNA helicase RuvA [Alphaproteobacteria bacterium]